MKKIVSICYYYPPFNSSEGYSAYKLFSSSKYKINIISQNEFSDWTYSIDNFKMEETIIYLKSASKKNWFSDIVNHPIWKDTDILITRSMPNESHIAGLKIKKKYPDIKWIAFFSDPFYNSPIDKWKFLKENRNKINIKKILMFYYKKIFLYNVQNRITKKADVLVFNNIFQQKYMLNKKWEKKAIIIPHTWVSNLNKKKYIKNEKIIFTFAGDISRCRNLDTYILAIQKINNNNELKDKVVFQFVGCNNDETIEIQNYKNVRIIPKTTYNKCLSLFNQSDWLVNSDANIQNIIDDYIYLPCKLIDYFSFTSNILNITNFKNGITINLVNECNGININDDSNEIYEFIKDVIQNKKYRNKKSPNIYNYNSKNVVKIFDNLLDKILC